MRHSTLQICVLAAVVTGVGPAPAQLREAGTPLVPVPQARWGAGHLRPSAILVDSTRVFGEPHDTPFPMQLVVSGGHLFMATGQGLLSFDLSAPGAPAQGRYIDGSALQNVGAFWGWSDRNQVLNFIAAPPGDAGLLAAGVSANGFMLFDTSAAPAIALLYQDGGGQHAVNSVYAATIGDRHYAFAAAPNATLIYDLTAAAAGPFCRENNWLEPATCPGVYVGRIHRNGIGALGGLGRYLIVPSQSDRIEIFDASRPASLPDAQPRLDGRLPALGGSARLWAYDYDGDGEPSLYMAALTRRFDGRMLSDLLIYDVSCVLGAGPCALGDPLHVYDVTDHLRQVAAQSILTVSVDRGVPYLAIGNSNGGSPLRDDCVEQREYLLDLSRFDPAAPPPLRHMDLTPHSEAGGYWAWYDPACHRLVDGAFHPDPPGFNQVLGRTGVVALGHYYRAGFSIADVHRVLPWPAEPPPAPDAGVGDAAVPSADASGPLSDAGHLPPDASGPLPDAGLPGLDAGAPARDASAADPDALRPAPAGDAAETDGAPAASGTLDGGCACRAGAAPAGPPGGGPLWLAILALGVSRPRARPRGCQSPPEKGADPSG